MKGGEIWISMGENTARRFGTDVTNQSEHKGGKGLVGRFMRYIRKPMDLRIEDNMGQIEGREMKQS